MASSASLVVRISADLNDFTKQLDNMTRGVDRAAKKIEGVGRALTIGITVPVVAATAALAKMAAENEDTGARLERVFGSAAASVNASIKSMMKSVPEANTELQKMAISVDNMAQGLGLAPPKAAQMSESLLKLAGDAAAFAHVPMEQALDALSRGLAGRTKGLLEFGIAIKEADIKQKAYDMGLLHAGNELTETGTALAAYALIMERSSRIQGEAGRTADQAGKQFAFLRRDLSELADNVSHLVLPSLSALARSARDVVGVFAGLDQSTVKTFFGIAAGVAVIGPAIIIIVRFVDALVKVRAAMALLAAGGTVAGFFGAIAALPIATVVAGVVALTAALGALYVAWNKFKSKPDLTSPLDNDPALNKALGIAGPAASGLGGANGPTERAPIADPMKALEERAHNVTDALKQMGQGWTVPALTREWFKTLELVQARLTAIGNTMDPVAVKLRGIVDDLKEAAATAFAAQALPNVNNIPGIVGGALKSQGGARPFGSVATIVNPQAAELPGLTAANEAAMRYAQTQIYVTQNTAYEYQALRSNLAQFGISLGNVSERMQNVIVQIANAAVSFASQLASTIGGSGAGASRGRGLGGLLGGIVGSVIPGVGTIVGAAVGTFVGTAAGGLIGGLFDHAKSSTEKAADSMNTLAKTVERVNASITNVPAWFKVQSYRFEAAPVIYKPPPSPTAPNPAPTPPPTGPGNNPTPINPTDPNNPETGTGLPGANRIGSGVHIYGDVIVQGVRDVQSFMAQLSSATLKAKGTGNASRLAFSGGIG